MDIERSVSSVMSILSPHFSQETAPKMFSESQIGQVTGVAVKASLNF